MSLFGRSLLAIKSLDQEKVLGLFNVAKRISDLKKSTRLRPQNFNRLVALVFFEPSTRTRLSFQFAAQLLGIQVISQYFDSSTSLAKGESQLDTLLNIAAMGPDLLVVRYGEDRELDEVCEYLQTPIVSAGSGVKGHPTQALGDGLTLWLEGRDLSQQKVLFVGDIANSRVAFSNIELFKMFGAEIGFCGPEDWMPKDHDSKIFNLSEGLKWCDVCMPFRIQWERHANSQNSPWRDQTKYHSRFGVNKENIDLLGEGLLLAPGPINQGVELSSEVLKDKRCRVLKQVENGVFMRSAILSQTLGIDI